MENSHNPLDIYAKKIRRNQMESFFSVEIIRLELENSFSSLTGMQNQFGSDLIPR
jgi:hypothetical protein